MTRILDEMYACLFYSVKGLARLGRQLPACLTAWLIFLPATHLFLALTLGCHTLSLFFWFILRYYRN